MKYVSLVTLTVQNSAVALSMRYARTRSGEMFIASSGMCVMAGKGLWEEIKSRGRMRIGCERRERLRRDCTG